MFAHKIKLTIICLALLAIIYLYHRGPLKREASSEYLLVHGVFNEAVNRVMPDHTACWKTEVPEEECKLLSKEEKISTQTFPPQAVAGVPGSGNDWILWLGSITNYTLTPGGRFVGCQNSRVHKGCLFRKMHQGPQLTYERAALLLRHPYDAAFSEYKRLIVKKAIRPNHGVPKDSTQGVTVDDFIDSQTNQTSQGFREHLQKSIEHWFNHATAWLTKYTKPLHILIYKSVVENTTMEIESLQRFFGYEFDDVNFRRHCCVMENSFFSILKRKPSQVDQYKEYIYEQASDLHIAADKAVAEVHRLLDKRFPNTHYRVIR